MKQIKESRGKAYGKAADDMMKKAAKLPPLKKSGKEKHMIFSSLRDEDDDSELESYRKKESILDYFDDGEEDI